MSGRKTGVSSITFAEIIYLTEKGRLAPTTLGDLLELVDQPDSPLAALTFDRRIAEAMQRVPRAQVPDMPDRIIAATALYLGVPLISRDGRIRLSSVRTIW